MAQHVHVLEKILVQTDKLNKTLLGIVNKNRNNMKITPKIRDFSKTYQDQTQNAQTLCVRDK